MLLNELHQGGIRAILAWEPTVFNNFAVPAGVDLADVVDHIIYKYGDTPLFSPDPHVLKFYFGRWSTRRLPLWNRYKAAIELEYNPIENYDRNEKTEFTHGKTTTYSGTVTDSTTGSIKVETDDVTTNEISADNASTYQPDNKSTLDGEQNTSFTNYQQARTFTGRTDADSGKDVNESRIHGNIGVTTSQQMLTSELDLIPRLDLIDYIADDWHDEFCLKVYY